MYQIFKTSFKKKVKFERAILNEDILVSVVLNNVEILNIKRHQHFKKIHYKQIQATKIFYSNPYYIIQVSFLVDKKISTYILVKLSLGYM